ncbi:MAG: DUF2027 domain-containing protein [Chlorobi bacterium]|nr:DUF2027 domain-containing protein [Chlorobiota bacterium]
MVKVGDKVKFLNDIGGGVVTRIVGKNLAHVENEDGFEIPTLISQLVKVEEVTESFSLPGNTGEVESTEEPILQAETKPVFIEGKDNPDFYLAFVPQIEENPVGGDIEAWLVNDSNFHLIVHYSHNVDGLYKSVWAGTQEPNSVKHLEDFSHIDLTDLPGFCFQVIYFSEESREIYQPVVKEIKVNPVKFYKEKTFFKTMFFKRNALLLAISNNLQSVELDKLTNSDVQEVLRQKQAESIQPKKPGIKKRSADFVEVDLHIHELLDNYSGLSNHEILDIQMDRFRSEMERAIKNKAKRIVFIHGIGQGTLKAEIIKELKTKYRKYYFQDASFKEYGYGATMVIFQRG